ncbi:MAG TPA: hypothetical protein VGK78_13520 [Nocardioides sp.]|uniref:hypothetical protein n=1 Tax=Nocardioides sp. TaxID=35761 RepID=UPI002F418413
MDEKGAADEKRMRLRYAGTCRSCGADLPAGTDALYERSSKTVSCLSHGATSDANRLPHPEAIDPGVPGASARREFERRRVRREERIRTAHPKLGGFIHAITDDPQSIRSWSAGTIDRLDHVLASDLPSA